MSDGDLFALLVLPDFSKISIAGFVDLERKVDEQAGRARELERTVIQLQTNQLQLTAVRQEVNLFGLPPDEALEKRLGGLEEKERAFRVDP